MSLHEFEVEIDHPDTEERVKAIAVFFFYIGWKGTSNTHPEPPEVDIVDVLVGNENILGKMSVAAFRHLEGEILEIMLQ